MKKYFSLFLLFLSFYAISQVPTVGLVAYYPFSGNANDMSGHGYNGTVVGASLILDRFGNQNSAYSFNGTSSYIDLSTYASNLNFSQPASISLWINTKYDVGMAVYSVNDGASSYYGNNIFIGANVTSTLNDELITDFQGSTLTNHYTVGFCTTNRGLLMNTGWHHIVLVFNNIFTQCYLDNVFVTLSCNWGTNNCVT